MRLAHDIRNPDRAWRAFARALTRHIELLERGEFLVVNRRGRNRFIQVASGGNGDLLLESVSNQYLEPLGDPLTERDFARLERLGWHRPTQLPPECAGGAPRPYGSPNFWQEVEGCADFAPVARLLVRTLRQVHAVRHPRQLEYEGFHRAGELLVLPTLGVSRRRRPEPPAEEDFALDGDVEAPSYGELEEVDDIDEGWDDPR